MSGKIQYKSLNTALKMLFTVEITEKTAFKEAYTVKAFDIGLIPDKTSFWSGLQNIEILRKPTSINTFPNNDADAFVQQVSTALYQLNLKLGFNGMPVGIEKQDELWQKWLTIRANLANGYTGDWIDSALTAIDIKMLPGEAMAKHIMQDLFLNEYFRGVYDAAFVENNFNRKRKVYGLCTSPILFNEIWELQSSTGVHLIKFYGNWDKHFNQTGLANWLKTKTNADLTEISVNGSYQLDHINTWCNALESNYIMKAGNSYEKTVKISVTTH